MRQYQVYTMAVCISLFAAAISGCGQQAEEPGVKTYTVAEGMESTPVVDYTVPKMLPYILADKRGYEAHSKKQAAVKGKELPEAFRLVDAETKEVVYSGKLDKITYNEELGFYTGYAVFDEYTAEGTYYIECDWIGRSYPFSIEDCFYEKLFQEVYTPFLEACEDGSLTVSEALALLQSYEWYEEVFETEKTGSKVQESKNQTSELLEKLRLWITQKEETTVVEKERALYAAVLAKFGYQYQKYDSKYATDCLRRASTLFGQVQTTLNKDADNFLALTELYRATGLSTYRNQIGEYTSFFENNGSYLEETEYLFGIMTYMSTRQKVDVELCQLCMNHLMSRAEEISKRYDAMIHPLTAKNNGADDLLKRAVELSCANYVLPSYQYTTIEEEFLHYLMGQNVEAVSFYPEEGEKSSYLFLLAQLAATYQQEPEKEAGSQQK